eukprot:1144741-Pelagomonas_calceolata.AAC.2
MPDASTGHSGLAPCLLCEAPGNNYHALLRWTCPYVYEMQRKSHHQALNQKYSKGDSGLIVDKMYAHNKHSLCNLGIHVPDSVSVQRNSSD